MKNKTYTLNTLLAAVLGLILLICVLVRTFAPAVIMPQMNVANLVLVSLIALVLDHYMASGAKRCYICVLVYGVITFGLLPWAAAFVAPLEALKLAVKGGVTFAITTWVFSSVQDRLSSGPAAKAAPVLSAFGLYLAVQCLVGII